MGAEAAEVRKTSAVRHQVMIAAWGMDYRKTQQAIEGRRGERWITIITRLTDGKILSSWWSDHRPVLADIRQVMGWALTKYARPEVIWCDAYLADWVTPIVRPYGVRIHLRMIVRRVTPAPEALPIPPEPPASGVEPRPSFGPDWTRLTAESPSFWARLREGLWPWPKKCQS